MDAVVAKRSDVPLRDRRWNESDLHSYRAISPARCNADNRRAATGKAPAAVGTPREHRTAAVPVGWEASTPCRGGSGKGALRRWWAHLADADARSGPCCPVSSERARGRAHADRLEGSSPTGRAQRAAWERRGAQVTSSSLAWLAPSWRASQEPWAPASWPPEPAWRAWLEPWARAWRAPSARASREPSLPASQEPSLALQASLAPSQGAALSLRALPAEPSQVQEALSRRRAWREPAAEAVRASQHAGPS